MAWNGFKYTLLMYFLDYQLIGQGERMHDCLMATVEVVKSLLDQEIVPMAAFDATTNLKVRVFVWSFLGYQPQRPLGLHSPPLSESDTTLGNPSAPSTNTHMCTN